MFFSYKGGHAMVNTILCFIIISIMLLLGFVFYSFLSKLPKKGETKLEWKFVLCKILEIEFKSEHNDNSKK